MFSASSAEIDKVNPHGDLEQDLLDDLEGFSKVIAYLAKCKKPIVGHNSLQVNGTGANQMSCTTYKVVNVSGS